VNSICDAPKVGQSILNWRSCQGKSEFRIHCLRCIGYSNAGRFDLLSFIEQQCALRAMATGVSG
jgi:hypothetical protein